MRNKRAYVARYPRLESSFRDASLTTDEASAPDRPLYRPHRPRQGTARSWQHAASHNSPNAASHAK